MLKTVMVLDNFVKIVLFANILTIHYLAIPRKGENRPVKSDFKKCDTPPPLL